MGAWYVTGRWHIHCAIELPPHFDGIALERLIRDCWAKVEWGYGRICPRRCERGLDQLYVERVPSRAPVYLSAPRQGIKTASASRKIGRESSTLRHPGECRRRQVPAAIDPVARRRRQAKPKRKKAGAARDPTHHQRGCHPARRSNPAAPRQGIKTASASRKIGRESSTLSPPAKVDDARCRPRSTR